MKESIDSESWKGNPMRVLLVEDDKQLNYNLKYRLEKEDITVDSCLNMEDASYYIQQNIHDLILLDRMIPGGDGLALLKQLRESKNATPVILITAIGELQDKVEGLNSGADDYIVKPFEFEELLARIYSVTRRLYSTLQDKYLTLGNTRYYYEEHRLQGPDKQCVLSKKEGHLLEVFLRSSNHLLFRDVLITKVWGYDSDIEDGNLDNYIHFIRRRLKAVNSDISIVTVRGSGYKITADRS